MESKTQSEEKEKIVAGSKWDVMLKILLKCDEIPERAKQFEHELNTMDHLYKSPLIRGILSKWLESLSDTTILHRSTESTNHFRAKGNEFYNGAIDDTFLICQAIKYYSRALYTAPLGSPGIGLAHANRAAALISVDNYASAYDDCEMAKEHSYPKNLLFKVLLRQATCSIFLKNKHNLRRNIEELENLDNNFKISAKVSEFRRELQKLDANGNNLIESDNDQQIDFKRKTLKEKFSTHNGRYIVSGEPITADEPILQENAFAFVPVYQKFNELPIDYNCHCCAQTNIVPFPCYDCCRVSYCSIKCRLEHVSVHRFECVGYRKNFWFEIGIAHLALRTALIGFTEMINCLRNFNDEKPMTLWKLLQRTAMERVDFVYGNVIQLITNFQKMDPQDYLSYSMTAALLTVYLKHYTLFFEELPSQCFKIMKRKSDWELFMAALIMRHMGQMVCNGHAISDLSLDTILVPGRNTVPLGQLHTYITSDRLFTAIFPQISLFNHSCWPNIRNKFECNRLTVYATRSIQTGDEILNCYGPNYKNMQSREDRQLALRQQYCFDCKCVKCMTGDNEMISDTYLCQNLQCRAKISLLAAANYENYWWRKLTTKPPQIQCDKCRQKFSFDWYFKFVAIIQMLFENDNDNDTDPYKIYDIYQMSVAFMSEYHEQKVDMLRNLLTYGIPITATKEYSKTFAKKLLKLSNDLLKITEYRYGHMSLEYVCAATFLLDLLAIRKQNYRNNITATANNIVHEPDYDLDAIIASTDILSNSSKSIFVNYIKDFVLT